MSLFIQILLTFSILISAICVVNIANPVHSVLFLIVCFLSGAFFFFLLRNEFIAIMLIIVYIGAIAVLFLFVIMMLDIKTIDLHANYIGYIPAVILVLLLFFFELSGFLNDANSIIYENSIIYVEWLNYFIYNLTNIHVIGLYLYTYYMILLLIAALLLFIATIGSIVLSFISFQDTTLSKPRFYYENISLQYFIDYKNIIKLY